MIHPPRLRRGDTLAAVSSSWGGPAVFPRRYAAGKRQLEETFGITLIETPHALAPPEWLAAHPEARAADLIEAFADPFVSGIVSAIGGEDSIRLLPYLDLHVIRAHPKIFLGYSDSTVTHLACLKAGVASFYGPSIMSGFAENGGIFPYTTASVARTLFCSEPAGIIEPNAGGWTVEYLDWRLPENQERRRALRPPHPWHWLQGRGRARGRLIGGCLDVLDWLRGTCVWPDDLAWRDSLLFLEISEEVPRPAAVARMLRALGALGVFERTAGLLFGRPGCEEADFAAYDDAILQVVARELGLTALPVVTCMDFGHTDPMFVLPCGVTAEIDCDARRFSILESAVSEP